MHDRLEREARERAMKWSSGRNEAMVLGLLAAVATAGCATSASDACSPDEKRLVSETLYFGTAKPGGIVDTAEWERFLRESVTSRFPEGLTVWQASGRWRGADGKIVEEASQVLNLIHAGDEASERKVAEIASDYKSRFQQEAVLRTRG